MGASFDEQGSYSLITQFMKNGNLIDFLQRNPGVNRLAPVSLSCKTKIGFLTQVLGLANYAGLAIFARF